MTDMAAVAGLKLANADLEFALDNCRRAAAGEAPRNRTEYELARSRSVLGSIFDPFPS
ncbi:hypothetical protein SEA_HIBISCUS_45 [Gordonia phage Hibiscus]